MNIYQVYRPRVEGLADKVYDDSNAKNIGNGLYVVKGKQQGTCQQIR